MRKTARGFVPLLLSIILSVIALVAPAQVRSQTATTSNPFDAGQHVLRIDLPLARIIVRLPNDMRAGDTISGTVSVESKDRSTLPAGMLIDVGGKTFPATNGAITFVVPSARSLSLIAKNAAGAKIGQANVPIIPTGATVPDEFLVPKLGQAGRPIVIIGPFDGNLENTKVTIGSQPLSVVAESPRKIVIQLPNAPTGSMNVTVGDQGRTASGNFRNLGVSLSAPTTNLKKGEVTTLTVSVSGLEGIQSNIPMTLNTTGAVNTEGGNSQQIEIHPSDIQSNGEATITRTLTGIAPGTFNVTATVVVMANLNGAVIHVEGTPNGGNGVWQVKVKMPDGTIKNVYIRSETKPPLQYCNWIEINDVTDEDGTTYVGKYKKVQPPKPHPPPLKPPDETKPPETTAKPPETTVPEPPPCPEGTKKEGGVEKKTFEVMDGDSDVTLQVYTDKDGAAAAGANMADFWKTIAQVGGLRKLLPKGAGPGMTVAGWLLKYLDKGGDVLNAVAKGNLKNLGAGKVTVDVIITTKKITAECRRFEVCVKGKWMRQAEYHESVEKSVFRAFKTASKGDDEWEKLTDPSHPQSLDPERVEKWARDFLAEQVNILKGNGESYEDFVKKCK